jgi:Bacterial SH3 domain
VTAAWALRRLPLRLLPVLGAISFATAPTQAALFCSVLKGPDGYVALRAGPGTQYPLVARMQKDDEVQALEGARGPWIPVHHWWGDDRLHKGKREKYRDGWVHMRFISECG